MSYCRFGPDSDVYAYNSGVVWTIHTAERGSKTRYVGSLLEFDRVLHELKWAGYKVPERVFDRIKREHYGEMYKDRYESE